MSRRAAVAVERRVCMVCGREIEWRRKWAREWENVKYCSEACRAQRGSDSREPIQYAILQLLMVRAQGATICPSEAARLVAGDEWRSRMEEARAAARLLVAKGVVEITQGGRVVDPSTARGPIRIRATRALLTAGTTEVERVARPGRRRASSES